jgi:hypothetical protein
MLSNVCRTVARRVVRARGPQRAVITSASLHTATIGKKTSLNNKNTNTLINNDIFGTSNKKSIRFVSDGTIEGDSELRTEIEKCWADPYKMTPIPTYQVMDYDGKILNAKEMPKDLSNEELVKIYEMMIQLNQMDQFLYDVQRHGRISFYMTNYGEEATHFGSAAAIHKDDIIFGQVRSGSAVSKELQRFNGRSIYSTVRLVCSCTAVSLWTIS